MHGPSEDSWLESLRRKRLALLLAVGAAWAVGVLLAIRSGFEPGYWWDGRPWPYPLGHVLVAIAQITVVSVCLYDFLRPRAEGSSLGRTARAAGVSFITFIWIALYTRTDQPGYEYVAGRYVLIVTILLVLGFLVQGAVSTVRAWRGRRHAA